MVRRLARIGHERLPCSLLVAAIGRSAAARASPRAMAACAAMLSDGLRALLPLRPPVLLEAAVAFDARGAWRAAGGELRSAEGREAEG